MSNVQEALKTAEKLIVKAIMFESEAEQYLSESIYELNGCLGDSAADISVNGKAVLAKVRAALSEIEKCAPVGEVSIDYQGFMAYRQLKNLPEGYHKLYTSPHTVEIPPCQPRDWVGLSDEDIRQCEQYPSRLYADHAKIIEAKLKQLNTKG